MVTFLSSVVKRHSAIKMMIASATIVSTAGLIFRSLDNIDPFGVVFFRGLALSFVMLVVLTALYRQRVFFGNLEHWKARYTWRPVFYWSSDLLCFCFLKHYSCQYNIYHCPRALYYGPNCIFCDRGAH